jgi:hypothetical protein
MNRLVMAGAVALLLVGCGSGGTTPTAGSAGASGQQGSAGASGQQGSAGASGQQQSPVVGTWIQTSGTCAASLFFDVTGYHEQIVTCIASDDSIQAQKSTGAWSVIGDQITTTISKSTCSNFPKVSTIQFQVTSAGFTVQTTSGPSTFRRTDSMPSASDPSILGCFDATSGAFTHAPFAPI